jgi:ribosome-binding ATPase YchF (GTP1/OBG family)
VQTEDLVLDEGGKGKVVEEVGEVFPDIGIAVFSQAFVVETVHLCDLAGLVVSAEDGDTLGIADFQANKECNSLDRVVATVDIITLIGQSSGGQKRVLWGTNP